MLVLFFCSCAKENRKDCFRSTGQDVTESREPGVFDKIMVSDNFEVEVFQGNEYRVEVTAGKNIIGNIKTTVDTGMLHISNQNTCNFVRGYKRVIRLKITLPHITYLENEGVGVTRIDEGVRQDSISLRVSSSGDIVAAGTYTTIKTTSNSNGDMTLKGSCRILYVYTNGVNYVNTEELKVRDYMFIHSVTLGDCYVNAAGTYAFAYNIEKSGNIYYDGDPVHIINYSSAEAKGRLMRK